MARTVFGGRQPALEPRLLLTHQLPLREPLLAVDAADRPGPAARLDGRHPQRRRVDRATPGGRRGRRAPGTSRRGGRTPWSARASSRPAGSAAARRRCRARDRRSRRGTLTAVPPSPSLASALAVGAGGQGAVGPRHDPLEDLEVDVVEVLEIDAADAGGVRPEPRQVGGVGPDAVHQVDRRRGLARRERGRRRVALSAARVAVVVAPVADGRALQPRRLTGRAVHEREQRLGVAAAPLGRHRVHESAYVVVDLHEDFLPAGADRRHAEPCPRGTRATTPSTTGWSCSPRSRAAASTASPSTS